MLLSDFQSVRKVSNLILLQKEYYKDVLHHLHDALWPKWLELWSTDNWHLHHNNAPAHSLHLIHTFLMKNQTPVVHQPPYSPDMAPWDFWLFLKLKRHWKGNLTKALNTTSLKCCLPSTDTIDRQGKIHACIWRFKVASCKHASLKSTRFSQKNKVGYFPNRPWILLVIILAHSREPSKMKH